MHKTLAARIGHISSRLASQGPAGFVSPEPALPTRADAVRSWARAWAQGKCRLDEVPAELREEVRYA